MISRFTAAENVALLASDKATVVELGAIGDGAGLAPIICYT